MSPLNTLASNVMQQFDTKPPLPLPPPIKFSSESGAGQTESGNSPGAKPSSPHLLDINT
jgi:hypothetical protein